MASVESMAPLVLMSRSSTEVTVGTDRSIWSAEMRGKRRRSTLGLPLTSFSRDIVGNRLWNQPRQFIGRALAGELEPDHVYLAVVRSDAADPRLERRVMRRRLETDDEQRILRYRPGGFDQRPAAADVVKYRGPLRSDGAWQATQDLESNCGSTIRHVERL